MSTAVLPRQLTPSMMYALALGSLCEGDEECHWCGSPCNRNWVHDDSAIMTPTHSFSSARRPGKTFICVGCWLWRRRLATANFLEGGLKDRQSATDHSWWITPKGAWSVRREDHSKLYQLLITPPYQFTLMLLDGGKTKNEIHLAKTNDVSSIAADTPLSFTINNIPHVYTVYELTEATRNGPEGTEPGVQALLRLLGKPPENLLPPTNGKAIKKTAGRPKEEALELPQKRVVRSGH